MPYILSETALRELDDNPKLAADVANLLDLKTSGLAGMITRRSRSLNTYHTVKLIAENMQLRPEEILTKEPT